MSDTLRCSKCKRNLPVTDFNANSKRYTGRDNQCRECRRITKRSTSETKRQLVRDAKTVPSCPDCGKYVEPDGMEMDHVRGKKKFKLANAASHSTQKIKDEIAKCEVVCHDCHTKRTKERKQHLAPDGRGWGNQYGRRSPGRPRKTPVPIDELTLFDTVL